MALTGVITGCANDKGHLTQDASSVTLPPKAETYAQPDSPPVVTLKIGKRLVPMLEEESQPLPRSGDIGPITLPDMPIVEALQAILDGHNIALSWQPSEFGASATVAEAGAAGSGDTRISVMNLRGTLAEVVETLCSRARVYCHFRNGVLDVRKTQTFIVELPPVQKDAKNTIADVIKALANADITIDDAGGNLVYTTDTRGQEKIKNYLYSLRNGRPLIVLQMYIWEVNLFNNSKAGIQWSDFSVPGLGPSKATELVSTLPSTNIQSGISIGAVLSGADIKADILASFLAKQGAIDALSRPQMTLVSGGKSVFSAGGSERVIKEVGTLLSGTTTDGGTSTDSSGVGRNTVSVEDIEYGLKIEAQGSFEGGTVFTTLAIENVESAEMPTEKVGTTSIMLPKKTKRLFESVLRVRPGDSVVLGGINSTKKNRSRSGVPFNATGSTVAPTYAEGADTQTELVILVKPSVIVFQSEDDAEKIRISPDAPVPSPAPATPSVSATPFPVEADPRGPASPPPPTIPIVPAPGSAPAASDPTAANQGLPAVAGKPIRLTPHS